MLITAFQIIILLAAILLPVRSGKLKKKPAYHIDCDTSNSQYAINEKGMLEEINKGNLQNKNK